MSHSPRQPNQFPRKAGVFGLALFSKPVLGTLLVLSVLLGVGAWRGLVFVEHELTPIVEANLLKLLNRPVTLGPLKRYSLTELEYGRSAIAPYTTQIAEKTTVDRDQASAESVVVGFNPWTILTNQTLSLDITLNQPQVYLDQGPDQRWIETALTQLPDTGWLKIKVNTIRTVEAAVKLDPFKAPQRLLKPVNGAATFKQNNQLIEFDGTSTIDSGGRVVFNGTWQPPQQSLVLTAQTHKLTLGPLMSLLPSGPLRLQSGQYEGQLKLTYQPQRPLQVKSKGTFSNPEIHWPDQSIFVTAKQAKTDAVVLISAHQFPILQGNLSLQGGTAKVPEQLILLNHRNRWQTAQNVSGTVAFLGASQRMQLDLKGSLAVGGQVKAKGEVKLPLEQAKLSIQAQGLPAALFDRAYELPLQVRAGRVGGNVTVQLHKNQRPSLRGIAALAKVDAAVSGIPQPFLNTSGYVRFRGLTATLDQVETHYGAIPLRANGSIDPDRGYDLSADTAVVEINAALKTLEVPTLPFPVAGRVQAGLRVGGAIEHPVMTGQVRNAGQVTFDRIPVRSVAAQFNLIPALLTVSSILASPSDGGVVTGQATLQIKPAPEQSRLDAQFQGNRVSGDTLARLYDAAPGFAIGLVSGTAIVSGPADDIQTAVAFQAPKAAYPTVGRVLVRQGQAFLQDIVSQITGGVLRLNGVVADNRVRVNADFPGLVLKAFSPDLKGALSGRLAINGPLAGFSAQTARAQGAVRFSQGLSLIQDPITAQIRWDGRQIRVDQASAPNFMAQGVVGARLQGPQSPQLTTLDLQVAAQAYEINRLAAVGLAQNPLRGLADLKGQLTGTVSAPALNSTLEVSRLNVSEVEFEPLLVGRLNFDMTQGLRLDVGGTRDRIQVALDANQLPISLNIRRDKASIIGQRQDPTHFDAAFSNVPLIALNQVSPIKPEYGPISGLASGTVDLNLQTRDVAGTLAVNRPGLGRFLGDRLTAQVRYAKGVGTLTQGELIQGENRYQLDATLANSANPQISGRLLIAQAQIEDLIAVGKALPFSAFGAPPPTTGSGHAADMQTSPVNLAELPIWQQLQRLAEIDQLLEQQKQQQFASGIIPDWEKLQGRLMGAVNFSGSFNTGLSATFDLDGQNWTIDPYRFDRFVAKGRLDPSGLTLEPLALTYGDSQAAFQGRVGGTRQSGQLSVAKLPIETVADLLDLPVNLTGQLNGTATLGGQWDNPAIQGQFSLDQGILNRTPIQQATTQFNYSNARLAFQGLATIDSPDPFQIRGNIPYALPFSARQPDSDQVQIDMSVKNQGLALVKLFTDQVVWVDGQGQLGLQVRGTVTQPLLKGNLAVQNATLQSPALAEPLTGVNGEIQFNSDRIMVKSLVGRYNEGELTAVGSLPVFDNNLRVNNPLTVALNNTALNLKGLYQGQASGNLNITGSAFRPVIGGLVALQNGQLLLSNASALSPSPSAASSSGTMPAEFKGLAVRLGDNIRILQPPILSFIASGNIDLDGSIDAPRPNGLVRFEKGTVNLFTTLFRIDERKENFARFTPTYGLDPYLNLSLRTTVTEVAAGRATALNEFADASLETLGSVESVRVRANIQGRASQLSTRFNDVLELTSVPNRSETEILALLSGGVTQSLQDGNAQGALVNLAGSAVLNRIQGLADDVLGSRASFRLFPLLTPTKDKSTTILELGAEFGYDVTDKLSLSLLQILTSPNELPQLNISYDINDQLRARGAVNFSGDAIGIVEYRIRF